MNLEVPEMLDLVNEHDEVIGQISRDAAWDSRAQIRVVNAFVRNSKGQLLIPRRNSSKRTFPNCFRGSSTAHFII